jgi:hypothetical protein
MATNLTVLLADRPGMVADIGEALGKAGVNLLGISAFVVNNQGFGYLLVDDGDAEKARAALEGVVEVADERDALVIKIDDRPGALGELTRRIAGRGVNLRFAYLATDTRLVVGSDQLEQARAALA